MPEYKDVTKLSKEIADFKKSVNSPNSDYLTGYLSALSVTEGIIANIPNVDVVKVVRCKDCEYYTPIIQASTKWKGKTFCCTRKANMKMNENDYCSCAKLKEREGSEFFNS